MSAGRERIAALASFRDDKMGKSDLFRGERLFAGLNAFRAGQVHEPHKHCDRDKLYVVMEGRGTATVADETLDVGPGDAVFAAADVEHSMAADRDEDLVVLVVLSPPPPTPRSAK